MPRQAEPPTDVDVFMALSGGNDQVTTKEDIFAATGAENARGADGMGRKDTGYVEHSTGRRVRLYKRLDNGTYVPREIPVQNLKVVIAEGFKIACPYCNTNTCEGPNVCPEQERQASRRCPVCSKRMYDTPSDRLPADNGDDEEGVIEDDSYGASTPATRTKAKLDRHILAFHPEESAYLGVSAAAAAVRGPSSVAFDQRVVEQAGV